jgi:hypothetical protein
MDYMEKGKQYLLNKSEVSEFLVSLLKNNK